MLKFLVDEQLPQALARWLVERGHQVRHVAELGLGKADDIKITTLAKTEDLVVITKDADFIWLHAQDPKSFSLIVLRLGNCTNRDLLRQLDLVWAETLAALDAGDLRIIIGL
jgi:predicted nuclease of predicted toxin-antitoxin system